VFQAVIYPTVFSGKAAKLPAKFELKSTCGCPKDAQTLLSTEMTGMPTEVKLMQARWLWVFLQFDILMNVFMQSRGKIYLSWVDNSVCESGFVFQREASGSDASSFTPMYSFESTDPCFARHAPSSIFDDLTIAPDIKLGSIQKYCVFATNPVGYKFGYRSNPGCHEITIAWESMVCCHH
jgi:hypothetical protein